MDFINMNSDQIDSIFEDVISNTDMVYELHAIGIDLYDSKLSKQDILIDLYNHCEEAINGI